MLQQQHRFHGHGGIRFLYRHGRSVRSSQMIVKVLENPHRIQSRFTVVVSKKIIKSAVYRNRVRRRLYEIIRQKLPLLKSQHDVALIVVSPELLSMDHESAVALVHQLCIQADLYK